MISDKKMAEMQVRLIKRERELAARRVGASWRIQAGGVGKQALIRLASTNFGYPAPVFDELCIDNWFHLEQMDTRDWYLGLGEIKLNIHVKKNGALDVMIYEGPDIREGRS